MAKPLTDDERRAIAELCKAGKSARDIARSTGRSVDTVSRIAAQIGHVFGRQNLAHAREARAAYGAEQRAEVASLALQRAREILEGFDDRQPVVVGSGEFVEVRDLELDARGQKDRAQAAQLLSRTVLDIARQDEKPVAGEGKGLLERLVDGLPEIAAALEEAS